MRRHEAVFRADGRPNDGSRARMYRVLETPGLHVRYLGNGRQHLESMIGSAWVRNRLPENSPLRAEKVRDVGWGVTRNTHCNGHAYARLNRVSNPVREVQIWLWVPNTMEFQYSPMDACHAIAHMIAPQDAALHGREFARCLLDVVGRFGYDPSTPDSSSTKWATQKRFLAAAYKTHGMKARVVSEETRQKRSVQWQERKRKDAIADLLAMAHELAKDDD